MRSISCQVAVLDVFSLILILQRTLLHLLAEIPTFQCFLALCRHSLFSDHGKLKVSGRNKKKKYTPKNGRINIATIATADATSRIIGKSLLLLLLLLKPYFP